MPTRKLPSNSNNSIALEPEAAIAIIGLFSAAADSQGISPTEENALSEMLEGITVFEDYTEKDFEALSTKINTLIDETPPDDLISSAIASLPNEDYREAAYVVALIVIASDEDMTEEEDDFLYELQEALNISDERAEEIIDEIFEDEDEYEEEEEEEE